MISRINVLNIIIDHFNTLKSLNKKSRTIYWKDLILFILFPIIVSTFLTWSDFDFKDQLGNLIAAISILGGFLFNLLAIIYSQIDKIKTDAKNEGNKLKERFVREIHINISFCILLSILIILTLLLTTVYIPDFSCKHLVTKGIIGLNYFLLFLFVLTLIMILNRVYILLKKESEY